MSAWGVAWVIRSAALPRARASGRTYDSASPSVYSTSKIARRARHPSSPAEGGRRNDRRWPLLDRADLHAAARWVGLEREPDERVRPEGKEERPLLDARELHSPEHLDRHHAVVGRQG